ncbi:MAG: hypothetical protein OEY52_08100 [Gammaproteobacteria bacterium]|nr:hypothetical protein [Gammaproteobacteria bacterium]
MWANRWLIFLMLCLVGQEWGLASSLPDRRRDQYPPNFGYFVYPIYIQIPGLGTAKGGGGTFVNVADSDTDLTAFYIDGDFYASGLTALNMHLIPQRLILDAAWYEYDVAFKFYERGVDSNRNKFIYPNVAGDGVTSQLTMTFFDKRLDFYSRLGEQNNKIKSVFDSTGDNRFQTADAREETRQSMTLGMNIDLTDDRQDPRRGFRFEMNRKERLDDVDPVFSTFTVYDLNLSAYIPIGHKNTWVWNLFRSTTKIERQGSTNFTELQGRFGFNCGSISDPVASSSCENSEAQYINSIIANNRYGTANPLGGTQRLRSYPGNRYFAGETLFIGTEYRWNLTEEYTPMDIYILRGHRTNMQLAFFAEAGSVAETSSGLTDKLKYSYGLGFRMLFEGTTLRADIAHGDEGTEMILFIDYPFSLYSVDSPG